MTHIRKYVLYKFLPVHVAKLKTYSKTVKTFDLEIECMIKSLATRITLHSP